LLGLTLAVLGGLAFILAFPPYEIWPLALVSFVPVLIHHPFGRLGKLDKPGRNDFLWLGGKLVSEEGRKSVMDGYLVRKRWNEY